MERIFKPTRIYGLNGHAQFTAVIDTGVKHSVLPRGLVDYAGAGRAEDLHLATGSLRLGGATLTGALYWIDQELVGSGCRARSLAFVPNGPWDTPLIGCLFLQDVGATIKFEGDHPITCGRRRPRRNPPSRSLGEYFFETSYGAYPDFEPDEEEP